jgi:hypothetical protein
VSDLESRLSAPCIVRHSNDLLQAIRDRVEALNTTHSAIENLSGLQQGYLTKIIADPPPKRISASIMFLLLQSLGLRVTLSVDPEWKDRYGHRLEKRKLDRVFRKRAGMRAGYAALEAMPPDMRCVAVRRGGRNRMRQMTPAGRSAMGGS